MKGSRIYNILAMEDIQFEEHLRRNCIFIFVQAL